MDTEAVGRLLQEVAAEVITPRFRRLDPDEVDEKGPGDLVTAADREAEELITRRLREAWPDAVVLGEEAAADDESLFDGFAAADHAFTVDPVDGTKNFVHGSDDHAVMAAELRRGEVVRGWIWQPQHEVMYAAERGGGAFRNGARVSAVVPDGDPADWNVVTSRRRLVGQVAGGLAPLALSWVCCGVDYPHVLDGSAAACLYGRAMPWDHAPGSLILAEAGGHTAPIDQTAYDPSRRGRGGLLAAASPEIHAVVAQGLRALPRH